MPQAHDLTLGGVGYTVAPKSYRRGHDHAGLLDSAPVRVVQDQFAGGLSPAQERDGFAYSLGMLPRRHGRGPTAGPRRADLTVAGTHPSARRHWCIAGGRPYVATGGALWRPDRAGVGLNPDNLGGATQLGSSFATDADGIATDGSNVYVSRSGANPYRYWDIAAAAWVTTPTLQFHGLAFYAGSLWGGYLNAGLWRIARATSGVAIDGDGYPIDGPPVAMITARDGVYTATRGGLWRTRAATSGTAGDTLSVQHDQLVLSAGSGRQDDWDHLCDHQGQIYAWFNGGVHRYHAGESAPAQMVPLGLWGLACAGLASAGGYLLAAVRTEGDPAPNATQADLWAWDGRGWWRLSESPVSHNGLIPTASYFDNAALLTADGTTWRGYQIRPATAQPGLAPAGELVTGWLHGQQIDADKLWTRAGAEFGTLAYGAFAAVDVALDYSLDGTTWQQVAAGTIDSTAPATLAADLPAGVQGQAIALRYRFAGAATGAPTLRALWAEYRPVETPARRRRWEFEVLVADGQVLRDGQAETRTGQQIAAALRAQFDAGGPLTLRDVDYDLDPTERQVRIAYLDELIPHAGDAGRWGDGRMKVRLVED